MDLFDQLEEIPINIIDYDGVVEYHGMLLSFYQSKHYFDIFLKQIKWESDQANIFDKQLLTKRKVAWYGDKPFNYTYSNSTKVALPWTDALIQLKRLIEEKTGEYFNACLLNLYHSGEEGMGWHCDAEKELKKDRAIGSLSLGAERKLSFKYKIDQNNISVILQTGSLLVMKGETQRHWLHRLPPTKKVDEPRINLTFRTIHQ